MNGNEISLDSVLGGNFGNNVKIAVRNHLQAGGNASEAVTVLFSHRQPARGSYFKNIHRDCQYCITSEQAAEDGAILLVLLNLMNEKDLESDRRNWNENPWK